LPLPLPLPLPFDPLLEASAISSGWTIDDDFAGFDAYTVDPVAYALLE